MEVLGPNPFNRCWFCSLYPSSCSFTLRLPKTPRLRRYHLDHKFKTTQKTSHEEVWPKNWGQLAPKSEKLLLNLNASRWDSAFLHSSFILQDHRETPFFSLGKRWTCHIYHCAIPHPYQTPLITELLRKKKTQKLAQLPKWRCSFH